MTDARTDWLDRIGALRQWSRGAERAPHKPLLILYALGRLQREGTSRMAYVDAEAHLKALLRDFGPPRDTQPSYPFHHLASDGFWIVESDAGTSSSSPSQLRQANAVGAFTADFEAALRADPALAALIAHALLDANFPPSMHDDICASTGLDLEALEVSAARARVRQLRRRDASFRERVLVAYERRCAMCGYDGWLGAEAVGLDAAHVRWWAYDGSDTIDNALCLCSLHHKLLDRGVLGITTDNSIQVSQHFVGRAPAADALVVQLAGRALIEPQRGHPTPTVDNVEWHGHEVFRMPARVP